MRLRSISERREVSHAPPRRRSNITAAARMTTRKEGISLKKIPVLTAFSLGRLEAVARAAYRLQIARVFRVRFDFFPDAANIHVHRARSDVRGIPPNGIQQMVAGKDAAEMTREVIEQAKPRGRGGNGLSATHQDHGGRIALKVADFERAG